MTRNIRVLAAAAVVLPLLCAALVAHAASAPADRGDEFQRLVGGLGLGPAVDASRCAAGFDPRLGPCDLRHAPLPCGDRFCPTHAAGP